MESLQVEPGLLENRSLTKTRNGAGSLAFSSHAVSGRSIITFTRTQTALGILLGAVLLWTGLSKLYFFDRWLEVLTMSPHLPIIVAKVLSVVVPSFELYLGAQCFAGCRPNAIIWLTRLLGSAFGGWRLWLYFSASTSDCGCVLSFYSGLDKSSAMSWWLFIGVISASFLLRPADILHENPICKP
jgi:hypothetical protein